MTRLVRFRVPPDPTRLAPARFWKPPDPTRGTVRDPKKKHPEGSIASLLINSTLHSTQNTDIQEKYGTENVELQPDAQPHGPCSPKKGIQEKIELTAHPDEQPHGLGMIYAV